MLIKIELSLEHQKIRIFMRLIPVTLKREKVESSRQFSWFRESISLISI
jgi:hypothetical protein